MRDKYKTKVQLIDELNGLRNRIYEMEKGSIAEVEQPDNRFKLLFDRVFDAIIMIDLDGHIIEANQAACKLLGYSKDEIIDLKLENIFTPEEMKKGRDKIRMLLRKQPRNHSMKDLMWSALVTSNGQIRYAEDKGVLVKIEGKDHILISYRDITERRKAKEALAISEKKYETLTNNLNVGVFRNTVGSKAKHIEMNKAYVKMFGYESKKELLSLNVSDLYLFPENGIEYEKKMLRKGYVKNEENIFKKKDGSSFIGSVSAVVVKDKSGEVQYFDGIIEDITEKKNSEEEIRHLSRQLISVAEEQRKKLSRDLHDDLGKTLTALNFSLEALQSSTFETRNDLSQRINQMIGLVGELGNKVRNLSSKLRPEMLDHFGLIPTLEWYFDEFTRQIEGIEIDFETAGFKKRLDPKVEITLYRIVQESLNNIAKYSKAKQVKIKLTYSHPKVIFVIKDNGVGFKQKRDLISPNEDGHGIGILGMRERVATLGGKIDIRSKPGKGTVIRGELPGK